MGFLGINSFIHIFFANVGNFLNNKNKKVQNEKDLINYWETGKTFHVSTPNVLINTTINPVAGSDEKKKTLALITSPIFLQWFYMSEIWILEITVWFMQLNITVSYTNIKKMVS